MNKYKLLIYITLAALIFITRLVHHLPNFTSVAGSVLLAGVLFGDLGGIILILGMYFASDLVINNFVYPQESTFYGSWSLLWIYIPIVINYFMSKMLYPKHQINSLGILKLSLISAIIFFIISNFGVWMTDAIYPKNFMGLGLCYWNAIPFFNYDLMGTLFFSTCLFGIVSLFNFNRKLDLEIV